MSDLERALSGSMLVKQDFVVGHTRYGFLLVVNSNKWKNSEIQGLHVSASLNSKGN